MNYTLHQLRVFQKVAQTESITKAAEELFLSQPAVSLQLKSFQEQFEIPLTETVGRRIYITEFGREIEAAAQKILEEVYAINYKALAHKGLLTGKLRIATVSTGKYVIPYYLSRFVKLHPGVELSVDVTNRQGVLNSLEKNEVDFALVSIMPEKMNVGHLDLVPNKLVLVGNEAPGYKRPASGSVLSTLPLILREEGSGTRIMMEKFIKSHGITLGKRMELVSNEAVKQAVLAGLGYSIMPVIGLKNELQLGQLYIHPIKDLPMVNSWHMCWPQKKSFSPAAEALLKYIEKEKDKIEKEKFGWLDEF